MRTIAHISDLHFGRIDPPVVEALVEDLNQRRPHLLVASGDFTQRARRGQYRAAAAFLARLPGPQLLVPGNHDIPLYDLIRRFMFPLQNYRRHICADLRPVYRDQEMIVIGLNTARSFSFSLDGFWKDGRISEEQLLDVQTQARDLPQDLLKIVVTHHPFIPPPGERLHGIVHGAARALDTMQRCGVDLLLAGHLHTGYSGDVRTHHEAVKRSILSIQAGTATSTRRRGQPNAYNWITASIREVTIEVRAFLAGRFQTETIRRFVRCDGVWQEQA
ncbi:metallophosphoesterase family protein [Fontivita pretiosa]|uniref:metallophosphoesterase family protein n=1 Tax=Fontivita pretiosa TaxID=2989684 RepID=UPI003D167638